MDMFLQQYPFDLLTEDEFTLLTVGAEIKEFKENEFLFHEDQHSDSIEIHFLVSGLAKNIMHRDSGKQIPIRFYYPSDLIGIMIILSSGEMQFSVQALEDCQTICFNKDHFMTVMNQNTKFSKVVLDEISNLMKSLYQEVKYKSNDDDQSGDVELYTKRVDKFMETPIFINPNATIKEAASLIQVRELEGLIVSKDNTQMDGLISYSEIIDACIEGKQDYPVCEFMKTDHFSVTAQTFIYDALTFLKHHPTSIIPVFHRTKVVGFLRQSSFFTINDSIYFDTSYKISIARSLYELKQLSPIHNKTFQQFVTDLITDGMLGYDICELITNLNDKIHRQVIQLAEEEMQQEGYGPPQINYCFIVMGSGGRKEQGFSTDQDNGLILANYHHLEDAPKIEDYFAKFSHKINYMLEQCGFPLCTGGIMAKEAKWRKTLGQWESDLVDWIKKMDAEEIRDFTIFTDFRPISGDYALAYQLRGKLTTKMQNSLHLQQLLMKDTLRFKVPLHPFGRMIGIGKNRGLNLKKSAIMQIVNAIRIYAIKNGLDTINTISRLQELTAQERYHHRDKENAKMALHRLLTFRLEQNLKELKSNQPLGNSISMYELSKEEKRKLRESLNVAKRLQQVLELSYNRNRVV